MRLALGLVCVAAVLCTLTRPVPLNFVQVLPIKA